ncbi:MAG: hypothetical protein AAGI50_13200 [Pseudomonadota bacterium]
MTIAILLSPAIAAAGVGLAYVVERTTTTPAARLGQSGAFFFAPLPALVFAAGGASGADPLGLLMLVLLTAGGVLDLRYGAVHDVLVLPMIGLSISMALLDPEKRIHLPFIVFFLIPFFFVNLTRSVGEADIIIFFCILVMFGPFGAITTLLAAVPLFLVFAIVLRFTTPGQKFAPFVPALAIGFAVTLNM